MEKYKRVRGWLLGATLGVFLALFLWPVTHWLVRSQITSAFLPNRFNVEMEFFGNTSSGKPGNEVSEVAKRHPDDIAMQFVEATQTRAKEQDRLPAMARVMTLTQRFPDNSELSANALRIANRGPVMVHRDENSLLEGVIPQHPEGEKFAPNREEYLAWFDKVAEEGERLEPDNAYFPFMHSISLFATHRDDEALEAIQCASEKPVWKEYYGAEAEANWRIQEEVYGHASAILRTLSAAGILFPHYSQLRGACCVAIYQAVEAERAGDTKQGIAIRRAVMRCGSLMRSQSTSIIGGLVGRALVNLAMERPNGTDFVKKEILHGEDTEKASTATLTAYKNYLHSAGQEAEIPWLEAEVEAGNSFKALTQAGMKYSPFEAPLRELFLGWFGGMVLLISAFWTLVLGGGAALLAKNRNIQKGFGLPSHLRITVSLGIFAGVLGTVPLKSPVGTLLAIGSLLAILVASHFTKAEASRLNRIGIPFLAALISGIVASLVCMQVQSLQNFMGLNNILQGLQQASPQKGVLPYQIFPLVLGAIPLLILNIIVAASLTCRVPVTVGLVRGLRGFALPVACLLLLGLSATTLATLRLEQRVNDGLQRTLQHEGRYFAELTGRELPKGNP